MQEYYSILGLQPGAPPDEIKKAYRKLAMEHHPDRGGNEEKFKKVTEAYEILSGKRQPKHSNPEPENWNNIDFQEMVNRMRGFGGFARHVNRPPFEDRDIVFSIDLNVEEVKRGRELEIEYDKCVPCQKCEGKGGKSKSTCSTCGGRGQVGAFKKQGNMMIGNVYTCTNCHGYGIIIDSPCGECGGMGSKMKHERLKFIVREKK